MKHDILDTRDLEARQSELQDLKDILEAAREDRNRIGDDPASTQDEEIDKANDAIESAEADFGEEEAAELQALDELAAEIGDEWRHGVALISDSYFETYAQDLAEDIEAIPKDATWPCRCIDWEQAATELQQDYNSVSFQGVDYWYRS